MRLPNLLGSSKGRLAAFFLLYITEGLPVGFTLAFVTAQLRRSGVGPAAIGGLVAAFLLPWSLKWLVGPLVDTFRSRRWGARRPWILASQVLMAAAFVLLSRVSLNGPLSELTGLMVLVSIFTALQGVAISGLAVNALNDKERGIGNGVMYSGMIVGYAIGGSGMLYLASQVSFAHVCLLLACILIAIALLVVAPFREPEIDGDGTAGQPHQSAMARIREFGVLTYASFLNNRSSFTAIFFCLLPAGALSLSLSLKPALAVELGFTQQQVAQLSLANSMTIVAGNLLGGWLSDRTSRSFLTAINTVLLSAPVAWLAWQLQVNGHIMPTQGAPANPTLTHALWATSLSYSLFSGMMTAPRMAIMMDITNPRVAATQFTAYSAITNGGTAFGAAWQGKVASTWGYPNALLADAAIGLLCVLLLPLIRKPSPEELEHGDGRKEARSRSLAIALAVVTLAWIPVSTIPAIPATVESLLETFFSIVFIGVSLLLLARSLEDIGARRAVVCRWTAVLIQVMHIRGSLAGWLGLDPNAAHIGFDAVAVIAAAVLINLAGTTTGASTIDRQAAPRRVPSQT